MAHIYDTNAWIESKCDAAVALLRMHGIDARIGDSRAVVAAFATQSSRPAPFVASPGGRSD